MDWLVVILAVTALAMIGVFSLIHRGRVRIWSICMILLGLGIGILLYTQVSILKSWKNALYIVFSIILALVLVYLLAVLGMRKQKKDTKADKQPEESNVIATASREPMRLSDWEAVISYSAAPPKANNEIRRVNTEKSQEVSSPVSLSSATFTPSQQADTNPEDEAVVADAITSFFRGNTQLPASAIRMDALNSSMQPNGKAEERKPYPEPLRVSSLAKPTEKSVAKTEADSDEAFEGLSLRVVRDRSAQGVSAVSQKTQEAVPETAVTPKASVTKVASAVEQEKAVAAPVYKVHKPASFAVEGEKPAATEPAVEQSDFSTSIPAADVADVLEQAQQPEPAISSDRMPEQPEEEAVFAADDIAPAMEEAQESVVLEEPAVPAEEPQAYMDLSPAAAEYESAATQEAPLAEEEAETVEGPEMIAEEAAPVEDAFVAEASVEVALVEDTTVEETAVEAVPVEDDAPVAEIPFDETPVAETPVEESERVRGAQPEAAWLSNESGPYAEPAAAAEEALPALDADEPVVSEQTDGLQEQFTAGMATLNSLIALKQYRNAQTLIFDLLRMEYEPTEEEKRRLLLIMKLLKEKESKNAEARGR